MRYRLAANLAYCGYEIDRTQLDGQTLLNAYQIPIVRDDRPVGSITISDKGRKLEFQGLPDTGRPDSERINNILTFTSVFHRTPLIPFRTTHLLVDDFFGENIAAGLDTDTGEPVYYVFSKKQESDFYEDARPFAVPSFEEAKVEISNRTSITLIELNTRKQEHNYFDKAESLFRDNGFDVRGVDYALDRAPITYHGEEAGHLSFESEIFITTENSLLRAQCDRIMKQAKWEMEMTTDYTSLVTERFREKCKGTPYQCYYEHEASFSGFDIPMNIYVQDRLVGEMNSTITDRPVCFSEASYEERMQIVALHKQVVREIADEFTIQWKKQLGYDDFKTSLFPGMPI